MSTYKIDIPGVEPTVEFEFESVYYQPCEKQTLEHPGCDESFEFEGITWNRDELTPEENKIVEDNMDLVQMKIEKIYRTECEETKLEMQIDNL